MQFMAATGIYGFQQPTNYLQFTACFSWVNFDVSLHLGSPEIRPASYPNVRTVEEEEGTLEEGRGNGASVRMARDFQQYSESLDILPSQVLLYKLFFFSLIFVPPLLLGTMLGCVGVALRPSEFTDFQSMFLPVILEFQYPFFKNNTSCFP